MELRNVIVEKDLSVKEALKRMNAGGEKILFVAAPDNALEGVLTDGDIRRHLLSGGTLHESIKGIYNPDPLYLYEGYDATEAGELMVEKRIEALPVVNRERKIVSAVVWADIFGARAKVVRSRIDIPVVIMAGGKGARLDPFTRILPKPLIPIGEKPIIEMIIDRFILYGASDFYVTLNYKGEMVKIYFDGLDKSYKVHFVYEKEFYGTAGSLKSLQGSISEDFIVSNCDIIVEADYGDLVKFHAANKNTLTVVGSIQHYKIPYGVIQFEKDGRISRVDEKPEFDFTANTGVYVLSKKALEFIPDGAKFDMTDLIQALLAKKENVGVYPVSESSYIDIGQWEEYKKHIEKIAF